MAKELKALDTSPDLAEAIINGLNHAHNSTTPTTRETGRVNFGGGITLRKIIEDQTAIGWTNFLCGRWGVKWKEAQRRHYLRCNKRKSARLWIIAILKKLILLRNDLWQFCNKAKHSPTGTITIASHYSLNYQISEEKTLGTDGINRSDYRLFKSKKYTLTKLHSSSITNKELWLHEVSLARKEYVEPDDEITRQAISQRNQMQTFLGITGPFLPTPKRDRPVATQDNCITNEEQHTAAIQFFGPPTTRTRVTPSVTTTSTLLQRTLFQYSILREFLLPFLSL